MGWLLVASYMTFKMINTRAIVLYFAVGVLFRFFENGWTLACYHIFGKILVAKELRVAKAQEDIKN